MRNRILVAAALLPLAFANLCSAQEARGTIAGTVTDPQGAVIPGASIMITNTGTNVVNRTQTSALGYFEVQMLNPGMYSITVEAAGFKKLVRAGLELSVAAKLEIPLQLTVGAQAEIVEVTAAAPLLDTMSASGGRTIDTRELRDLPFQLMNPMLMQAFSPGMQHTQAPGAVRWFDHAGASGYNTLGGGGANEYMLDGAVVTGTTSGRVGYVPITEAIEEFKLETMPADASYGYTGGAVVNMVTKSGTNTVHGNLFEQHQQTRWNALEHWARENWLAGVRAGTIDPDAPKQPAGRLNQFGGSITGPVYIPKVFDGRNKLFFSFEYGYLYSKKTSSEIYTVPTAAWKAGDFSELQKIDPVKYTIYDPRSSTLQNGRVVRTPFPDNKGIPVLNPAYSWWVKAYPEPNNVPGIVTTDGVNNFYTAKRPMIDQGPNPTARVDYNISDSHRVYAKYFWNERHSDEYDFNEDGSPYRGLFNTSLFRPTKGASADWLYTLSPQHILNVNVNFSRYSEGADPAKKAVQVKTKASDLGLPKYLDEKAGDYNQVPDFNISGIASYPGQRGGADYPMLTQAGTNAEAKIGMTSIVGRHSLKYGFSERRYYWAFMGVGRSTGQYNFDQTYMRAQDNTTTASNHGLSWAAFMMALPTSGNIPSNDSAYWGTRGRALYLQDDIRITSRLRLGLGLRYEREGGITERFNRAVNGGFDFNFRPAFADAAEAAYASVAIPELPASQFKVRGGTYYMGANGQPKTFTDGTHDFLPNVSVTYSLNNKTVIGGVFAMAADTRRANAVGTRPNQNGYGASTPMVVTNDLGLNFCCGVGSAANLGNGGLLNDPFPVRSDGARYTPAYGNSLGAEVLQGQNYNIVARDIQRDQSKRWRFSFQREIGRDTKIEASYNGAVWVFPGTINLSMLPEQYWSKSNVRDNDVQTRMTRTVANPFNIANLAALQASNPALYNYYRNLGGRFTATTLQVQQLVRAFPNFGTLNGIPEGADPHDYDNKGKFHDLEIQFSTRRISGVILNAGYARSYGRSTLRLNEFDQDLIWQDNSNVRPHRLVASAIIELPVGRGKPWLSDSPLRHILGGWQTGWVYEYQAGPTVDLTSTNRFFYGDINNVAELLRQSDVHSADFHAWFDPASLRAVTTIASQGQGVELGTAPIPSGFVGFEGRSAFQPTTYQVRTIPRQWDALRADGIMNIDAQLKRRFHIYERLEASVSVDVLNLMNHTNLAAPNMDPTSSNFGRVTAQNGADSKRRVQLNLRLDF
jgi:hypothetical protein